MLINCKVKQNIKEFRRNGEIFGPGELVKLPAKEAAQFEKDNIILTIDEAEAARLEDFMANRPAELLERKIKEAEAARDALEIAQAEVKSKDMEIAKLKEALAEAEAKKIKAKSKAQAAEAELAAKTKKKK